MLFPEYRPSVMPEKILIQPESSDMQISFKNIMTQLREQKPFLSTHYGVDYLGVFGSFVRNEQTSASDLDLLIAFHKIPGLLKFIEIEDYLTDLLGIKVDLVEKDSLRPAIGQQILSEVLAI
jgi:uncharacterized protein